MEEVDVKKALEKVEECERTLHLYITQYEALLDKKYDLIQNVFFMRLLTQISKKNYLHKIRLQFSTYVYDCGMLCENTTKLLLCVDEILSYGNMDIKTKRKQLVNKIQLFQSYLSKLHQRSKNLNIWFRTRHQEPVQLLNYPNVVILTEENNDKVNNSGNNSGNNHANNSGNNHANNHVKTKSKNNSKNKKSTCSIL